MTQSKQVYKCSICGNIVEVLHPGAGALVCCGKPMELEIPKYKDDGAEKHLPVVEILPSDAGGAKGVKIKIGKIAHPMTAEHHIEWIEIIMVDSRSSRKFLNPDQLPETDFYTSKNIISIRAYCNIHGLWEIKIAPAEENNSIQ